MAGEEEKKAKHNMLRPSRMEYHPSGAKVFMYYDEPGVYRDINDNMLPEVFAKMAGFPVEKLRGLAKLKLDRDTLAAAAEKAMASEEYEVVEERATYRLVSVGNGYFHIEKNDDGGRLMPAPMSYPVAKSSFDQLDPEVAKEEEALVFPPKKEKS